jgi:hypothetical protein
MRRCARRRGRWDAGRPEAEEWVGQKTTLAERHLAAAGSIGRRLRAGARAAARPDECRRLRRPVRVPFAEPRDDPRVAMAAQQRVKVPGRARGALPQVRAQAQAALHQVPAGC